MKLYAQTSVVIAVAVILFGPAAFAEESPLPFHYSDEWSLVSAPPPSGPYRPVNIDPRIPGASAVEPMPVIPPQLRKGEAGESVPTPGSESTAAQVAPGTTEEAAPQQKSPSEAEIAATVPGNAPSAGTPVPDGMQAAPVQAFPSYEPPPAAGAGPDYSNPRPAWSGAMPPMSQPPRGYGRALPPMPQTRNYPAPWYPYQPGYPGTRNAVPPPGYDNPQRRSEEPEVPPPPDFEGMYGRPRYPGNGW
jgi:hypothetical protein